MIPPLERLSLWQRIALAIGIVVLVVLVLMFISWLIDEPVAAEAQLPSRPSQWDEHMLTLDKLALDEAYRDRISDLFTVWMRDATGQPQRAINGATQARRAYLDVMQQIQERDKAIQERKETPK